MVDRGSETENDLLPSHAARFLTGGGVMATKIGAQDWSATSLGEIGSWPTLLTTTLGIMLPSRFAMWLGWGPDLAFFWNDAYGPTLGLKAERALGQPARCVWSEIWADIGPRLDLVMRDGVATWDDRLPLFLERSGFAEETFHTFSYSPLLGGDGTVQGILCVVSEETERVIGARQLGTLRELAANLNSVHVEEQLHEAVGRSLRNNLRDLPFAAVYLCDEVGASARLAVCNMENPLVTAIPEEIAMDCDVPWPAAQLRVDPAPIVMSTMEGLEPLPVGAWRVPPRQIVALPISRLGSKAIAGFMVVGVNPHRRLDEGYVGFIQLIADQIGGALANARAYEDARRRARELTELDRAKTAFFANISHEFRTPLTLILGPLEEMLAEEQRDPPPRPSRLNVVHRNAIRLLRLVNALLDFSRLEAGRAKANFQAIDLAELTRDLAAIFRSTIEKAGLQFAVDAPQLTRPVHVDSDMWEKIVLNLLSNAFKFTFAGEIGVELGSHGECVTLRVRDSGIGIEQKDLPRLFDRFHRIEGSRGRTHEGSGIGLALTRELVLLHGGTIDVESAPGIGTSFVVQIPWRPASVPDAAAESDGKRVSASPRADAYRMEAEQWVSPGESAEPGKAEVAPHTSEIFEGTAHILLAEDNADMRDYVRRLLSPRYSVETTEDGEEALAAVRRRHPALILSDVMMPRLDGFALLREVRSDPALRHIPFIMLSARAGEEARLEGLDASADDYLTKPFSAPELLSRVQSQIRMAKLRRESAQQLTESEARFRAVSRTAPIIVWTSLPDGAVTYVSDQWHAYTGCGTDAPIDWVGPIHPEDRERCLQAWRARVSDGAMFQTEARLLRHDGAYRWFIACADPVRDQDGYVVEWVGTAIDIHDFRLATEKLRENEEMLRLAQDAADMGVWSHDITTGLVQGSPIVFSLFDLETSTGILPSLAFRGRMHPTDRLLVEDEVTRAMRDDATYRAEFRIHRRDGSEHWLAAWGRVARDAGGAPLRITGVLFEITDRRRREVELEALLTKLEEQRSRLDTVIQHLPVGAGLFDRNANAVVKNPELDRYLVTPDSAALPALAARWRLSRDREVLKSEFPGARALRGESVIGEECLFRTTDGQERWTRVSGVPIRNSAGIVAEVLTVIIDIDNEKRAFERQTLLIQELNHRVKNTLATVQSIASFSLGRSGASRTAFAGFEARLLALSRAHDVLTRESWQAVELAAIVHTATLPFAAPGAARIITNGPRLRLQPKFALAIAMAIHELVTNASKYGALSRAEGGVHVQWSIEGAPNAPQLLLRWEEHGGPRVSPPRHCGFGSTLLRRGLALEIGGAVELYFAPSGVIAVVTAPLISITDCVVNPPLGQVHDHGT